MDSQLSTKANYFITRLDQIEKESSDEYMEVNEVVSDVAAWYEKLRNAMDYKEDEVVLRSAIERILKRRFFWSGANKDMAEPLVRELVWARYFPDTSVPKGIIEKVGDAIESYATLYSLISKKHKVNKGILGEWMMHLLSSEIENILRPSKERELFIGFIFEIFRSNVTLDDADEQTRDAQVFLAVRKAFAKDDIPLQRFHLFKQYFGAVNKPKLEEISDQFLDGYKEINKQLTFPAKDRIYTFVKNQIPPFVILADIFYKHKGKIKELVNEPEHLDVEILNTCQRKYQEISKRVGRAIVRSVIFIFITKAVFGLTIEATFEKLIYGEVYWMAIAANTLFSPILMVIVSLFIRVPDRKNSVKIKDYVHKILYTKEPQLSKSLIVSKNTHRVNPILLAIYITLWFTALVIGLSAIHLVLNAFHFTLISQAIFVFFLTVVSFLAYRISQTAKAYTVLKEREGIRSVLFDFFFMPFIQLGKQLTVGISQVNIFIFIFDYLIETPFKEMFAFFEQWFLYLRRQRETLE